MCNAQLQQGWWWGRGDGRKPLALDKRRCCWFRPHDRYTILDRTCPSLTFYSPHARYQIRSATLRRGCNTPTHPLGAFLLYRSKIFHFRTNTVTGQLRPGRVENMVNQRTDGEARNFWPTSFSPCTVRFNPRRSRRPSLTVLLSMARYPEHSRPQGMTGCKIYQSGFP